jgi:hypothetical protein
MSISDYLTLLFMFLFLHMLSFMLGKWQSKSNLMEKASLSDDSLHVFLKIKLNEKEPVINNRFLFQ